MPEATSEKPGKIELALEQGAIKPTMKQAKERNAKAITACFVLPDVMAGTVELNLLRRLRLKTMIVGTISRFIKRT